MSIYCYASSVFFCSMSDVQPFYDIIYYCNQLDTFGMNYRHIIYQAQSDAHFRIKPSVTIYYCYKNGDNCEDIVTELEIRKRSYGDIDNYKIIMIKSDIVSHIKQNYHVIQPHVYDTIIIDTNVKKFLLADIFDDDVLAITITNLIIMHTAGYVIRMTIEQLMMIITTVNPKKLYISDYNPNFIGYSVGKLSDKKLPLKLESIKFIDVNFSSILLDHNIIDVNAIKKISLSSCVLVDLDKIVCLVKNAFHVNKIKINHGHIDNLVCESDKLLTTFYNGHHSIKSVATSRIISLGQTISYLVINPNINSCAFHIGDTDIDDIDKLIECINMSNLKKVRLVFSLTNESSYTFIGDILSQIKYSQLKKISVVCTRSDRDTYCGHKYDYKLIALILNDFKKIEVFKIKGIFFHNYLACLFKYLPDNQTLMKISANTCEKISGTNFFNNFFNSISIANFFESNYIIRFIHTENHGQILCDGIFRNRNYAQQRLFKRTKAIVA
jgi:hypothetical protein